MASRREATSKPASRRSVRIELTLHGEKYVLEQNVDLIIEATLSHRRGEDVVWDFNGARVILNEEDVERLLTASLTVMDDERKWRVVEAVLEDLERSGFLLRKGR